MRRRRFSAPVRRKKKREDKVSTVESIFSTFNNLMTDLPNALSATADTQKGLEDAERVLSDLGEKQFPAAKRAAPYVGGVFVLTSVVLMRSIYKEIS